MTYYRIKADADQIKRKDGSILIANELYTPSEVKRFKILDKFLEKTEISQKQTYISFGARFAINKK